MPALHIEIAVRETSRNTARMVECISMPGERIALQGERAFLWSGQA